MWTNSFPQCFNIAWKNSFLFFKSLFKCLLLHELAGMKHKFPMGLRIMASSWVTVIQLSSWDSLSVSSSGWRQAPRGQGVCLSCPPGCQGDAQVGSVGWVGRQNCLLAAVAAEVSHRGTWALPFGHEPPLAWSVHLTQPLETLPKGRGLEWYSHGATTQDGSSRNQAPFLGGSGEEKVAGLQRSLTKDRQATALGLSSSSWLKPDPRAWSLWWNWILINVSKGNILWEGGRLAGSPAVLGWAVGWAFLLRGSQEPLLCGVMTTLRNWIPMETRDMHCHFRPTPLLFICFYSLERSPGFSPPPPSIHSW